jgi:hypothetical protein
MRCDTSVHFATCRLSRLDRSPVKRGARIAAPARPDKSPIPAKVGSETIPKGWVFNVVKRRVFNLNNLDTSPLST